jgi:molybdenum cofactor cytidylyltransferase
MVRASSFAGVILAAGESSRMGRDKALLPWPPPRAGQAAPAETLLTAGISLLNSVCDFVMVVVGKNEKALAPTIYGQAAFLVSNPDPARGQFSSLQVGLREVLDRGRDAAVVTLVDRPPISPATLQILHHDFAISDHAVWAVVPEFGGTHGHPYLVAKEMIEVFLRAPATSTAREVEHEYQAHIRYLPVDDPLVAMNINTPEDYEALLARPL